MLEQPVYALSDAGAVRRLIDDYSWVTIVSNASTGLVVSHAPVLADGDGEDLVLSGHLAWEDGQLHELGDHEIVIVVQGPHGYVSPSFYVGGPYVPTWNFIVVHVHGRPEILSDEQTYDVLDRTVDQHERHRPDPWRLDSVQQYAHRIAPATIGFRLVPTRIVAKAKLSQDKPAADVAGVLAGLDNDETHGNRVLSDAMRELGVGS
jgi:transcriptional regulator